MITRWFYPLSLLVSTTAARSETVDFRPVEGKLKIQSAEVKEASGLAISRKSEHFLWAINDSGSPAEIHLMGTDGSNRGKIRLKDTKNVDWEDLASFKLNGKSYLLVADTGDNNAARKSCVIHIVPEPALPADGKTLDETILPAWRIQFRYEDGPRDCESVAVDAASGKIILMTKRTKPPEIHELPLQPGGKRGELVARKLGPTSVAAPVASLIPFHNQPTAMDINAGGTLAVAVTYYGVFLFPRDAGEPWEKAFGRKPVALPPHQLPQAESVAFSNDGKTLYVVSEGANSPIKIYQAGARE